MQLIIVRSLTEFLLIIKYIAKYTDPDEIDAAVDTIEFDIYNEYVDELEDILTFIDSEQDNFAIEV